MSGSQGILLWRMLLIGMLTQVAQVFLFREAFASMRGLGILYGVALASGLIWTAAGTVIGGHAAKAWYQRIRLRPWLQLGPFLAFGPALAAGIIALRLGAVVLVAAPGSPLDFLEASLLVVVTAAPAALCGGFAGGLLLGEADRHGASLLYGSETIGMLIGGALCTFVLAPRLQPVSLALFTGALSLLAMLGMRKRRNGTPNRMTVLLASCATGLAVIAFLPIDDTVSEYTWSMTLPRYTVEATRETPYGRIARLADSATGHRVVFHNNDQVYAWEKGRRDPALAELAAVCCAQRDSLRNVCVIGGGLGEFPDRILEHGAERVDVLEVDPGLFDVVGGGAGTVHEHIRQIGVDGRHFVRNLMEPEYDLLILQLPDLHSSAANRFGTREFFQEISRVLTEDGVLSVLVPTYGSGPEYQAGPLVRRTASVAGAVASVFPDVDLAPVYGHLLIAGRHANSITLDPSVLARRLLRRPASWPPDLFPALHGATSDSTRMALLTAYVGGFGGGVLAAELDPSSGRSMQPLVDLLRNRIRDVQVRINSDSRPAAVLYSLLLWDTLLHPPGTNTSPALWVLQFLEKRKGGVLNVVLMLFVVFLAVAILAGFRRQPDGFVPNAPAVRSIVYIMTCVTGAFGITAVVFILHVYQSAQGYVYAHIGLLNAAFMAGMACGVLLVARSLERRGNSFAMLVGVTGAGLAGMLAIAAGARFFSGWVAGADTGTGALVSAAGVLAASGGFAGMMFPALLRFLVTAEGDILYAMDLFGSALGAILLCTFLMTAGGPIAAMDALAVLVLTMAILLVPLILFRRRSGGILI